MFLLDTNVVSELRRLDRAHPMVAKWAIGVRSDELYLSAVTVLELETGTARLARRDRQQSAMLREWIDSKVLPAFDGRILPVDLAVAQRCAGLHVPNPRADLDALIGATALVHGLKVVTRNVADFEAMGVELVNPWQKA